MNALQWNAMFTLTVVEFTETPKTIKVVTHVSSQHVD